MVSLSPAIDAETLVFPLIAGSNDAWKTIIESLRLISVHQFSPQAIRGEPKIGGEERLSRDGDNVGDVLKHLNSQSWYQPTVRRSSTTPWSEPSVSGSFSGQMRRVKSSI
jgi:hypothetical protein